MNLQKSDTELYIQCLDEACQELGRGKCYHFSYIEEDNDLPYNDCNQQYEKLEDDNDYINPDIFTRNVDSEKSEINTFDTKLKTDNELGNALLYTQTDLLDIKYTTTGDYGDHQNDIDESPSNNDVDEGIEGTIEGDDEQRSTSNIKEVIKKKHKSKKSKKNGFGKIILSLEEQKIELEANRRKKKYIEAEYKCYHCALGFLFKDTYQAHMMRHEEVITKY